MLPKVSITALIGFGPLLALLLGCATKQPHPRAASVCSPVLTDASTQPLAATDASLASVPWSVKNAYPTVEQISALRSLLKIKTRTDRAFRGVPKRVCDLAATDIKRLLRDQLEVDDFSYESSIGAYASPDKSPSVEFRWSATWQDWDNKIAELEKRLDSLGYP